MNQLNENLSVIRRQKSIYTKRLEESNNVDERKKLSEKIILLNDEERKLLEQLGV